MAVQQASDFGTVHAGMLQFKTKRLAAAQQEGV
jgi:hypothetical protein